MTKHIKYQELIQKRRNYDFSSSGLHNPAETNCDVNHLEPWAQWQGNLDAKILLIGQEYCDKDTYCKTGGLVERKADIYEYPSNKNLYEYFKLLNFDLGHPLKPQSNPIFFTNAVMGLKPGSMSSNFKDKWLRESREEFLKPLIDIIQPEVIITVGSKALKTVGAIYKFRVGRLRDMVEQSPIQVDGVKIFPVYHTGGIGLANRAKALQIQDWKRIKEKLPQWA